MEKVPLLVGWIQKEATVYILGGGRKDFFFSFLVFTLLDFLFFSTVSVAQTWGIFL